jgi:hypothetical protein
MITSSRTSFRRTVAVLAFATLVGCAGRGPVRLQAPPPPPPALHVQPQPGHIWVQGHWHLVGERWEWSEGYWVAQKPGYVWIDGAWYDAGGYWKWRSGHWEPQPDSLDARAPL